MTRLFTVSVLALLAACAPTIEEERATEEPFHEAVNSWVGANVDEMIAAWGQPDRRSEYQSPEEPYRAHWTISHSRSSGVVDVNNSRLVRSCDAFVIADKDGTILAVDAKADRCVEMLGERLADLHR